MTALANNQLSGYGYDAAGNILHDATNGINYSFDPENRLTGAAGFGYTYDADGNRVEKSNGSTGTLYWSMSPGIVAESDLSGNLKSEYVFFGGRRVARKDFNGGTPSVSYYFSDELQTASVITNAAGTITEDEDFYPWGGEVPFVNSDTNHYKFGGHERDSETGLDYMLARYYSNPLGRFLTPDWAAKPITVPYANFGNPQSLNLYTFGKNNPRTFGDPDGHCSDDNPCSNVKATVTAPPVGVVENQKTPLPTGDIYRTGVGTTATITLTDKKGNPLSGVSVKETPTSKDNLSGKSVPTAANPTAVKTSPEGTIKDNVTASLRDDSQPHEATPADVQAVKDAAASLPYNHTTDQTLTFSTGGQTCTCTYSETLSNVDSKGNLNTQTNSQGTNFTFTTTKPVVTPQKKDPQ